ncbi:unnamed protein product [Leptidea sinapis]|uniref:Uncharacterized protein n=1 Tax=Leptidea sinapis TaxID=189913 RepID=A0A5E4QSN3_9NEOP|nr:unnamed protein product [Leptidea sinapis]
MKTFIIQAECFNIDCFDYPQVKPSAHLKPFYAGWRTKKPRIYSTTPKYRLTTNKIRRRVDILLSNHEDIVKEHAKLVQDINSLRQIVYVAPPDDHKDYDDSIFLEALETSTTVRPTHKPRQKPGIPIVVLGGQKQEKNQSKPSKPGLSLVGTSVSPVKHPYPFVVQTTRPTIRICMATPSYPPKRPSLLQRLLNTIIPR